MSIANGLSSPSSKTSRRSQHKRLDRSTLLPADALGSNPPANLERGRGRDAAVLPGGMRLSKLV
jgi:hypothetical protein